MKDFDISPRTGISRHYMNEWTNAMLHLNWERSLEAHDRPQKLEEVRELRRSGQRGFVRGYTERFPPSKFDGVVDSGNFPRIHRLNELAEAWNARVSDPNVTPDEVRSLYDEAERLIYGSTQS